MLNQRETSQRDEALARVQALIESGNYAPGDRLPPERELTDELGLTRARLRRALDALERNGTIWRHVGKGTFVAGHGNGDAGDGVGALSRQVTPVRMMQARLCIEPAIAREAAVNASGEAITRMKLAMERSIAAPSWADYETHDDLFHRSIAEASDNILLLALFDQLNQVRRAVAWVNVKRQSERPPRDHSSFGQHAAIAAAIEARDPRGAQDAMREHLRSVSARLFEEI
ncbi:MAG: FadR/GntR family transcriptional regulator [Flavobacteriaceae bacterium]